MNITSEHVSAVANTLVDIGVVRVAGPQPFFYTSGWASPVYVDASALMSEVDARDRVLGIAVEALRPLVAARGINTLVGTAGSGIAFAAWLAHDLNLPMLYLRKRPVGWGLGAQLEGRLPPRAKALLVDDVTTDGRSKIDACNALRRCGAEVGDVFVIVNFDIYPQTHPLLLANRLGLHSLVTWAQLFEAYAPRAPIAPAQRDSIAEFNAAPVLWSVRHGGVGQ
jgi:orotate phosphoribosyltransferase